MTRAPSVRALAVCAVAALWPFATASAQDPGAGTAQPPPPDVAPPPASPPSVPPPPPVSSPGPQSSGPWIAPRVRPHSTSALDVAAGFTYRNFRGLHFVAGDILFAAGVDHRTWAVRGNLHTVIGRSLNGLVLADIRLGFTAEAILTSRVRLGASIEAGPMVIQRKTNGLDLTDFSFGLRPHVRVDVAKVKQGAIFVGLSPAVSLAIVYANSRGTTPIAWDATLHLGYRYASW